MDSATLIHTVPFFVMQPQKIQTEIALQVAPDGMNMISIFLGVVILDEEKRAVEAVIMRLAGLFGTCPGEVDGVQVRISNLRLLDTSKIIRQSIDIRVYQFVQMLALVGSH